MNENKLTVTVHIPNNDGSLLSIPHPSLWDHNRDLPLMPGDYFPLLYVCQKHDLSFNKCGSSTYGTDSRALVLVLLYHDYKSVLPFCNQLQEELNQMTEDKREQLSVNISNVDDYPGLISCPRIQLFMIDKKQPGRGFETMGGGGNPFSVGT